MHHLHSVKTVPARIQRLRFAAVAVGCGLLSGSAGAAPGPSGTLLFANEGNRLRRFDVDTLGTPGQLEEIFIPDAAAGGRDVNGMICRLPDGSGRYVMGEDSGPAESAAGLGRLRAGRTQVGKLTASYLVAPGRALRLRVRLPTGLLFTTEVGDQSIGETTGQLILWFPPYDVFPGPPGAYPATNARSTNFCKLAIDIGTAGGVAIDADGRVYVTSSSGFQVLRFSPPFPTGTDAARRLRPARRDRRPARRRRWIARSSCPLPA